MDRSHDFFFIGDPELVTAFRFVGIAGQPVHNQDEASIAFRGITGDESAPPAQTCKVLIITEEVADWLLSDRYPMIVEVPPLAGKVPGRKTLVDSIREAIGVRI